MGAAGARGFGQELEMLLDAPVSYTSAIGSPTLREAIAALEGVEVDEVQVVTARPKRC